MPTARAKYEAKVKEIRKETGVSRARAEQQAGRQTLDEQDQAWREQGRAAAGDDPSGWGL